MAHIIVVGNEKGGAGKSTVSMHVATALARMGHKTSVLDLDLRQRTFGRYVDNRKSFLASAELDLPSPEMHELPEIEASSLQPGENIYDHRLSAAVAELEPTSDFILIDCPGSHTRLSQVAHSLADTLITPLNDSFIDFDLLARTDAMGDKITGPSRLFRNGLERAAVAGTGGPCPDRLDRRAQPHGRAAHGQQGQDGTRHRQPEQTHRVPHCPRF